MSTTETQRRTARPSISAYGGKGLNLRFLCARCDHPSDQKGSKLRFFKGLRRRMCGNCAEEMKR